MWTVEKLEKDPLIYRFPEKSEGKVGASLFLMDPNVLKVEAFGGTGVNILATTDKELQEPHVEFWPMWDGLKGVLNVKMGWGGWAEFQREWFLLDPGPLIDKPWVWEIAK